ncbi:MAG TPA: hypothetical protein PK957_00690 [Candidatus Dojkabacteria bacterium]|nr:hypothetical protein [Candidatus Dojkabacteria bacterium]HQF36707.1 hypothetical protein [Candidatus Dojkabacteria bacterium]
MAGFLDSTIYRINQAGKKTSVKSKETQVVPRENALENLKYEVLMTWKAPMRFFRKRPKEDYIRIVFIALCAITFFFIIRQYMLIAVTVAMIFLTFVMWSVPPELVEHKITTRGVYSIDKMYEFSILNKYWFSYVSGIYLLNIETELRLPARLILLIGDKENVDQIHVILRDLLPYKIISKQNWVEERMDGIYIPLSDVSAVDTGSVLDHSVTEVSKSP